MNFNIEQLEPRLALDADSSMLESPVYGPDIPDDIGYIPPPMLMRPSALVGEHVTQLQYYIENNEPQTDMAHPVEDADRGHIWDTDLHALFSAYASDDEITVREARDLVVDTDDSGYTSRFEVLQIINYIYDEDYQSLYNTASQVFMVNVTTDFNFEWSSIGVDADAPYLREGIASIRPVADYWWNVTQQVEGKTNAQTNFGETRR